MMFVMWGLAFVLFMILALRFTSLILRLFRPVWNVLLAILEGLASLLVMPFKALSRHLGRKWTWIICGALAAIALYSFIVNG